MSEWSIDDGEVHLWRARLDRPESDVAAASAVLSADELERANRGSSVVRRRRILSRSALRHTLAGYLGVAPVAVSFTYGDFGKPRLREEGASPPGLHFNLSRSDDYCLIGVSRSELGVDVERLEPRADLDELAGRYFAPAESATIKRLEGESKTRAFFRCWTCKEAVLKAVGSGLAGGSLARFTVSLEEDEEPSVTSFEGDPHAWRLALPPVDSAFLAAVALRDGVRTGPLVKEREPSGGGLSSEEAAITCLVRLTQET
jgi:4'-phosphopantetheinyl transferase